MAKAIALPPQKTLQKLFEYDPHTGIVRRRVSTSSKARAGAEAGCLHPRGYRQVSIGGVQYLLHRIIWRLFTGNEPETVDHIDRDPRDNRWENLRDASMVEQNNNRRDNLSSRGGVQAIVAARLQEARVIVKKCRDAPNRNSTSRVVGVYWHEKSQRWQARITIDGERMHLGLFDKLDDAALARQAAVMQHNVAQSKDAVHG